MRSNTLLRSGLVLAAVLSMLSAVGAVGAYAQYQGGTHAEQHVAVAVGHSHDDTGTASDTWEGSAAGIAYSERNHHIAGWLIILMGLAEVSHATRLPSIMWARLLLPSAMLFIGIFVMVWSDHEAWPIGPLSFTETFYGQDHEIVQHKIYGLLALAVGSVELFRRVGRVRHMAWATPLPLMAIVGGLMLFSHSHGVHPSAHKIAMHHAAMGMMAVTAGSSKLFSGWAHSATESASSKWEWLWAGLILLIGVQLLIYSE